MPSPYRGYEPDPPTVKLFKTVSLPLPAVGSQALQSAGSAQRVLQSIADLLGEDLLLMRLLISRLQCLKSLLLSFGNRLFRLCMTPVRTSLLAGTLADLPLSKAQLLAENALLRHQLLILQRQVRHPHINRRDRFWFLVLASHISNWQQAPLIIQPDTI